MKPVNSVSIVLAAGASSRMKTSKSKLEMPLLGKTIVERAWIQAESCSSFPPLFVVGHQRDEIQELLNESVGFDKYDSVVQDPPRGTGDAIRLAVAELDSKLDDQSLVFIMGGDAILLRQQSIEEMFKHHAETKSVLTFLTAHLDDAADYGRVVRSSSGRVEAIVEAKNATPEQKNITEINAGFYLISFKYLKECISEIQKNELSGEFYLTDIVENLLRKQCLVSALSLQDPKESFGINTQQDFALALKVLQQRKNNLLMSSGVCLTDPDSIFIDDDVIVERDVRIEPNVSLKGKSILSSGVHVESHSIINNSRIGNQTRIKAFSHIDSARIESFCEIGPYARIRPGSRLEDKVKIGNFVEVKKSHFEKSSKANHLSYIGDAEVGESSNIGAGTITCNYDGFHKYQTKLGKNVFIGSNSCLVAPVEVGDGALVGAGSVITNPVPADAIAVERSEQKNQSGAAKRFREKRKTK